MANASLPITNFTAGELSKRVDGRVDLSKYFNGCSLLENATVFPVGGAQRRMGFEYIGEAKNSAKQIRLIPFQFNVDQTYILEFGEYYIRFYTGGELLMDGGSAVEVVTTYLESELEDIRVTQSADIMYIVHPNHHPAKLSRLSATTWTLADIVFTSKPSEWVPQNYPSQVAFFQQRLCYAATPDEPQTIWMSAVGDFDNFTRTGLGTEANAIEIALDSDYVNGINWMLAGRLLTIGTSGGEWTIGGSGVDSAITVTNIQAQRQTTIGSEKIPAVLVSSSVVYVEREGRKLREFAYLFEQDGYSSPDLTLLADHMGKASPFTRMAFAARPDSTFWLVREDGKLVGMTYQREEGVVAFHRHDTDGLFEDVATIPGEVGVEVYVVVKRTIGETTKRYIERMAPEFIGTTTNDETCAYTDCHKVVTAETATDTFAGFSHLIGETVSVLADGSVHPDVTVNESGEVVLTRNANTVCAGYGYTTKISPMRLEGGSPSGVSQGKRGRISEVVLRFYKTLGAKFGGSLDNLETLPFRSSADLMGAPPALFTGDKIYSFPQGFNRDKYIYVVQDQPLPLTITMMVPYVTVNK